MSMFVSSCTRLCVLLFLCMAFQCVVFAAHVETPENHVLVLPSTFSYERQKPPLSVEDWGWLREKQTLILGVSAPDFPPLDVSHGRGGYEGMTSDVVKLLGKQLGLEVLVVQFTDRASARQALEQGRIDLLGRANRFDQDGAAIRLSIPYAKDRAVLLRRQGDTRRFPADLGRLTVAVSESYVPVDTLQGLYPQARIVGYGSPVEAMAALAFGRADAYLGDSYSAHYQVNRSFYNLIKLDSTLELDSASFSFALKDSDVRLQGIIDEAIRSLGARRLESIVKRWVGSGLVLPEQALELSGQERRWLARNPEVRLVVGDDQAPLAFFDVDGNLNGVASELLDIIRMRTGLRFTVERMGAFRDAESELKGERADLALMLPSARREAELAFSQPLMSSHFALVTRGDRPKVDMAELKGRRLAVVDGEPIVDYVRLHYPEVELVVVSSALDTLSWVDQGKVDAGLLLFSSARYYLAQLYERKLQISSILDREEASIGFAMRRGQVELQSILDKVILSVPPDDMNEMINRWRGNAAVSDQRWRDYRNLLFAVIGVLLVLVLVVLLKMRNLQSQISQRHQAERGLSDQLDFLRTLIDSIPLPIYVRDREGRMVTCSHSYESAVGVTLAEVQGKTVLDMPSQVFGSAAVFHADYMRTMDNGEGVRERTEMVVSGTRLWVDRWIEPYRDASGKVKGAICGWLDITEQQELIVKLEAARQSADRASQAKTTFLATMSHEIRTPMNAVIGTLELALKRAEQGTFDRAGIETAYASARSLLDLIGDILDIVRIESGHLSLAPTRANVRELLESTVRVFDGLARQKGLELLLEIDSADSSDVLVDPLRFKQILSNLISNAIKFTTRGHVKVRLSTQPEGPDIIGLRLQVSDTGIGISAEDQQLLFRPFVQVSLDSLNTRGGTGLGLAISRSLCELMGGALTLHSVQGEGTRVNVTLQLSRLAPVVPVLREAALTSHAGVRKKPSTLVVDDHPVNRALLREQLQFIGYDCEMAEDGRQALELWSERRFDLLLTDCHMPRMTGMELAAAIRHEEALEGLVPTTIVGITADAQQVQIECCLAAGMNDCLVKPVRLDELQARLAVLEEQLSARAQEEERAALDEQPQAQAGVIEALMQLVDGDMARVAELTRELLKSNRGDLEILRTLSADPEPQVLSRLAHRIKGAARVINDEVLMQHCKRLEQACFEELPVPVLLERVAALEQHMLELEQVVLQRLSDLS